MVPASGVSPPRARSNRPIITNAVESSSSPVTSTPRYHRDANYEILPNSSSTRRHHQRYSSLGTRPADEDSGDKVYLLSRPSIRERQDENGQDNAEFRTDLTTPGTSAFDSPYIANSTETSPLFAEDSFADDPDKWPSLFEPIEEQPSTGPVSQRTHRPRGYISGPVADYQNFDIEEPDGKGQSNVELIVRQARLLPASATQLLEGHLSEFENVVGPRNSSWPVPPAPLSEVEDPESSVSASEVYVRQKQMPPPPPSSRKPSRIGKSLAGEGMVRRTSRSAHIDEVVKVIEESDDPQPRRHKKRSGFGHGESVSGSSNGADMELVDRLVLLWTNVEPQ